MKNALLQRIIGEISDGLTAVEYAKEIIDANNTRSKLLNGIILFFSSGSAVI